MTEDTDSLRAALADRTLQLAVLLDALGERDRQDAAQREWDFALQLQTGNLPNEFPAFPDRPEFDIRGGMVTAFQVGGDVYDFYFNDDRRLAFVVADASGKGLPAAIFITRMRTILRAASRRIVDPAQCLTLLNEVLCFDNPDLMFVTAFYGILDTATGEVVFANAGHNPPVHVKPDGSAAPVQHVRAPILGAVEGIAYRTGTLMLAPGDTLCCFSDGVTEAHDPDKALFGDPRLLAALTSNAGADLAAMEAAVIGEVDRFIGSAPIADDLTLLLLRWNGLAHDRAAQSG
jgi:sigma-B regulation protein RsbU (phosphoserine phosphatase)